MGKRFACTACGKCCFGQIPLTIGDALAHADIFPLAMVWTPLRPNSRDYDIVSRLGVNVTAPGKKELAVQIIPTAYIPKSLICPALGGDNLCGIHERKPLRCRTMPFYPYVDEKYQSSYLVPRSGWECDISSLAPPVFEDGTIIGREDFDSERRELERQAPVIRMYAAYVMKFNPQMAADLLKASRGARAGHVVTSLSSFLTGTRQENARDIARKQLPVLDAFIEKTAGKADLSGYNKWYAGWAKEMAFLAGQETG